MRATGVGSHPGEDQRAFDEALRVVLGELAEQGDAAGLPYLPEVPGRGAIADLAGRTLAVVADLGADLQPAGWRLTGGGAGVDHRRARSLLAQDLDALEEQASGYVGAWKAQVAGPWTLAATVERPRGDRVLGDHGARRDLAQALAEGVGQHVADLRRRLPGAALVVQIDEPAIAGVHAGRVPTASGLHRHRSVDRPELAETLGTVVAAVREAGAEPWVHSCAPDVPWDLVRASGASGLLVDRSLLRAADLDVLASALEDGLSVGLGVVAAAGPPPAGDRPVIEGVLRWLDVVGLDPAEVGERLLVTPDCGLAGVPAARVAPLLRLLRGAARSLASEGDGER